MPKAHKHTPTPWTCRQFDATISIDAEEYLGIAFVNPKSPSYHEGAIPCTYDRNNAEYIVRCVNHHAILVKALQDLLTQGTHHEVETGIGMMSENTEAYNEARAALAAATK